MKENKETKTRPPVITMLGHVNHGKTSLLDAIRGTKVQLSEAGGITQNVRAHKVIYKDSDGVEFPITFIDTPGHEAFSKMRQRGANVTDIAVLVVAIDDGVQPQTEEAAKFALAAGVPIIVALNKSDLKGHDVSKIKRDLANIGVQVEELGGNVMCVETSVKSNTGIDDLLSSIVLLSQMDKLIDKKPKKGIALGIILESQIHKSLGPISLTLIKEGNLEIGNFIEFEDNLYKIRAIKDEFFNNLEKGSVSEAVWILGAKIELPIGEQVAFYKDEKDYIQIKKESKIEESETDEEDTPFDSSILSELLDNSNSGLSEPILNIILKSENQGTLEVAEAELEKLSEKDARIHILKASTGEINEEDISNAKNNSGIVLGFKTKINKNTERIAKSEKILVRNYEIIYTMLKEVGEVIESLKKPRTSEVETARAKVKKVFTLTDGSIVAGCEVLSGNVIKGYSVFVERPPKKEPIHTAKITSLRQGKDEVHEASKGTQCGIILNPSFDIEEKDEIICFRVEKN